MDNLKQCDFLLMRYAPDPYKNEVVNIGVLLLGREFGVSTPKQTRIFSARSRPTFASNC